MSRLGKRQSLPADDEFQEKADVISSPEKKLPGSLHPPSAQLEEPAAGPRAAPNVYVQVCPFKEDFEAFRVVLGREEVFSKKIEVKDKKKKSLVFLQVLQRLDESKNYFFYKNVQSSQGKKGNLEELLNFGNQAFKAVERFRHELAEVVGSGGNYTELDEPLFYSRNLDVDSLELELQAGFSQTQRSNADRLLLEAFSLQRLEANMKTEGLNLAVLKAKSRDNLRAAVNLAYLQLGRLKQSFESRTSTNVLQVVIDGCSGKFWEKIPNTFNHLEIRKFNLNTKDELADKILLLKTIAFFDELICFFIRLREAFDYNELDLLTKEIPALLRWHPAEVRRDSQVFPQIEAYFKAGLVVRPEVSHFTIAELFSLHAKQPPAEAEARPAVGLKRLMWTPVRSTQIAHILRHGLFDLDYFAFLEDVQDYGRSLTLFDLSGPAIDLYLPGAAEEQFLLACEVDCARVTEAVASAHEMKVLVAQLEKASKTSTAAPQSVYLKGLWEMDWRHPSQLQDHSAVHVPTPDLLRNESDSDFLFSHWAVFNPLQATPKFLLKLKPQTNN